MQADFSTLPLGDEANATSLPEAWCLDWVFPTAIGQRWALSSNIGKGYTIGRAPNCNITLASNSVSRAHAQLRLEGRHVAVVDLNSKNGVFVNGQRTTRHCLRPGDLLRIGECIAFVRQAGGEDRREPAPSAPDFHLGESLRKALAPLARLATTDLPIVVQGETGTGKERTARAIHDWSQRPGPFVAVNCAALPENLAEAELFGYRRGAFSGAEQASLGHLRAADGGTLFLDEVAELPLTIQAKLLRALELGEVQPLGESRTVRVNLRVLSAAQRPLDQAVSAGKFRADLLARLNGFTVALPALRERLAELPSLFMYQLARKSGGSVPEVDARVIEQLCQHEWSGNVRELDMVVRRLLGLHGHQSRLLPEHLGSVLQPVVSRSDNRPPIELSLETESPREQELPQLLDALRLTGGNLAQAAVRCGMSRQRAYRVLQAQPGLDLSQYRRSEG